MESNTFKSAMFGGFDRQDVISYIELTSRENAAKVEKIQCENHTLETANESLTEQLAALRRQLEELTAQDARLRADLDRETATCGELEGLKAENAQLRAELSALQPQAKAYQEFKMRIGDIECEAHRRADELEASTTARLNHLVAACRSQYEELVSTFDVTSNHVTGELRKVEVNLSQLPRAMDQVGANLTDLEAQLHRSKDGKS